MVNPAGDNRTKLLIVDDQKTILKAFSRLLKIREDKYFAEFCPKPVDALKAIKDNPQLYDIIMTDIRMPDMDGLEFIRAIRQTRPDIPVIFMTAYFSPEVRKEALNFKKVVFLQKPFHLMTILDETIPELLKDK